MATWTRQELEELHPDGTVTSQVDDVVNTLTTEQWDAWIEAQVGTEKPEEDAPL